MNFNRKEDKPILVIGYGDAEKSDEAAGCRIAELIEQKELANIQALSVRNLTPSLASLIVKAKTVIFISTYFLFDNMQPEMIIKHFIPNQHSHAMAIDYPNAPNSLLSFTNSIYCYQPNALWMLIPAVNYQQGAKFSCSTQKAINHAIGYLINPKNQYSFHLSSG